MTTINEAVMRNATAFPIMFFLALFFRSTAIVEGILAAKTNRDVGFGPPTFIEDGCAHGSSDLSPARLAGLFDIVNFVMLNTAP